MLLILRWEIGGLLGGLLYTSQPPGPYFVNLQDQYYLATEYTALLDAHCSFQRLILRQTAAEKLHPTCTVAHGLTKVLCNSILPL